MAQVFTVHGYQHEEGVSLRYISGSSDNPRPKDVLIGVDIRMKELDTMAISEIAGFIEGKLRAHFNKKNGANGKSKVVQVLNKIIKPKPGQIITNNLKRS